MNSVHEEWRTIPGHPNYEVSNFGNVRSVDHVNYCIWKGKPKSAKRRGKVLKLIPHKGYLETKLGKPELMFGVHRLVAWAFIGPQENGKVVNHIDGDKTNNTPANLEYITNSENVHHAYRTGLLSNRGSKSPRAKLNEIQVREILQMIPNTTTTEIAKKFGVEPYVIRNIRAGKCWKHVPR